MFQYYLLQLSVAQRMLVGANLNRGCLAKLYQFDYIATNLLGPNWQ